MCSTNLAMDHGSGELVAPARVLTAADVAVVDDAARRYVRSRGPVATKRRYDDDMRLWSLFCADQNLDPFDPLAISEGFLTGFVTWLDRRDVALNSMNARVTGVVSRLRELHGIHVVPKGISANAFAEIGNIERELAEAGIVRGRGPAEEISLEEMRAMCEAQPDTLIGLRNRTYLSMAGYLGNRIDENCSLRGSDIVGDTTFLRVTVRWSKTGPKTPVLSHKPGNDLSPTVLWATWRDAAGITDGPAFPAMDRHGNVYLDRALTTRATEKMILQTARLAGVTVHVTGHTFRAFMATYAYLGGATIKEIADQGGWHPNSPVLWRYIRRAQELQHNATTTFEF